MKTLTFQNTTLTPVKTDNQIWLSSADLARALGYSQSRAVSKLYNENQDEFTPSMTALIPNPKMKNANIRIFSLKGCHLIAMFARTNIAKEFRKWVLDILEMVARTDSHQRAVLVSACDKLAVGNALRSDIYKMVGKQFGYDDVVSIPAPLLPEAVAYVYELLLAKKAPAVDDKAIIANTHNLVWHTMHIYRWYNGMKEAFYALSPQIAGGVHDHILEAKSDANRLHRLLGFEFDKDCPRRLN